MHKPTSARQGRAVPGLRRMTVPNVPTHWSKASIYVTHLELPVR